MRYALALLTMPGREAELERTLASFERMVEPRPTELLCHIDGHGRLPRPLHGGQPWSGSQGWRRRGFCHATAVLWQMAAQAESPWVFWLEDDFEFRRRVRLDYLAHVLESEPHVQQMALCRQAVAEHEIAAGGVVAARPGEFARRGSGGVAWLEQRSYWTTNPSLFRRELAQSFPWPTEQQCEGLFGFGLKASLPGTSFGMWGVGDAWVEHIGVRTGGGY